MKRIWVVLSLAAMLAAAAPANAERSSGSALDMTPKRVANDERSYDFRAQHLVAPVSVAVSAARDLADEVPGVAITWNGRTGTVKQIFVPGGTLGRPVSAPAERIARAWIERHRGLFGLSGSSVASLALDRDAALPGSGMRPLVFRVRYGDLATFDGGALGVAVLRDGSVLSAWGDTGPSGTLDPHPVLSARDALRIAASSERVTLRLHAIGQRRSGDRLAIFGAGGLAGAHNVRLVAVPAASGPRLAWRVYLAKSADELLVLLVDARDGEILYRANEVKFEGEEGLVVKNYWGAPHGGRQESVSFEGDPDASPAGWVGFPAQSQGTTAPTTVGNNVLAFTDWAYPKLGVNGLAPVLLGPQTNPLPDTMPLAPDRKFNFTFENNWAAACDPIVEENTGSEIENPSYAKDKDESVTNVFYLFNKIHDLHYKLGFTEAMGNFQFSNFGKGGKESDPVRVMAMAGILNGQIDNAWFATPPDGGEPTSFTDPSRATDVATSYPPMSAMFLNRPVPGYEGSCSDNSNDASTVWHEYTHGVTNRTVGDPNTADGLNGQQSGSMGEAWSDWFALHFLWQLGLEDRAVAGGYPDNNFKTGVRNFALGDSPLTYADFGYSARGPEVHNDGEIWAATLWDLREALVARYGAKEGADRAGHVVFDGLTLSPPQPTYLNMRDAIMSADVARYHAQDRDLLWRVFAARGMGASAHSKDADDVHPTPAFNVPSGNGTLTGVVADAEGGTLPAKIIIGWGEGAANPVVVTKANGKFSVPLAPGTYRFTVAAPGYGVQEQQKVTIGAGATVTRAVELAKNLASVGWGGSITSGAPTGDPGLALIDDHEASQQIWDVGKPLVIKLAGTGPAQLDRISIAPRSRSIAREAQAYTVETSLDGSHWTRAFKGGVKHGIPFTQIDHFSRVTIPFAGPRAARYVRVTVSKTFLSAQTSMAEVEAFGSAPGVTAAKLAGQAPTSQDANVLLANAGGGGNGGGASITENEWLLTCSTPPAGVQGLDGYVYELPEGAGDGVHTFALANSGGTATDLDVYFWNADCSTTVGQLATGAANETGPIPAGAHWALVVLYAGTTNGFAIKTASTLESVVVPTRVEGRHVQRPAGGGLPATGVDTHWLLALALLGFALAVGQFARRAL